jgi:hypothetical protein
MWGCGRSLSHSLRSEQLVDVVYTSSEVGSLRQVPAFPGISLGGFLACTRSKRSLRDAKEDQVMD